MAYDPYKAAAQIVRNKGLWGTAVAEGKSGDEYHKRALYYYNELRSNGYSGVADKLEASNYGEAVAYLDTLPHSDDEYDENKELADASAKKASVDKRRDELYDTLRSKYGKLYEDAEAGKLSEGSEAVLERYMQMGKRASDGVVADGASSNGGNVDSYAAANAHRQMNDYLAAGNEAAQKAENERVGRLMSILDGMYGAQSGLLKDADTSAKASADTAFDVYSANLKDDAEKRKEELERELAREERDFQREMVEGPEEKITVNDLYGDRYEKYFQTLLKLYPDYAEEIQEIFHFLG